MVAEPAVTSWHRGRLSQEQSSLVRSWLPQAQLVRDMSWNLLDTAVLHVADRGSSFVVKAAGPANHHIGREITAHETAVTALAASGRAPRLVCADRDLNVLLTEYLDGELVEGTAAEHAADTYAQAGRVLQLFHAQHARADEDFEPVSTAKALAWLDRPHRIAPALAEQARKVLRTYRPGPVTVVPTHGDWQPRNWLVSDGHLRVIDFGRYDYRPAMSDLCRLAVQQWHDDDRLEGAFLRGYGNDPRDRKVWPIFQLREAVSTACWAYQVGAEAFEQQGHRMLREALTAF